MISCHSNNFEVVINMSQVPIENGGDCSSDPIQISGIAVDVSQNVFLVLVFSPSSTYLEKQQKC